MQEVRNASEMLAFFLSEISWKCFFLFFFRLFSKFKSGIRVWAYEPNAPHNTQRAELNNKKNVCAKNECCRGDVAWVGGRVCEPRNIEWL